MDAREKLYITCKLKIYAMEYEKTEQTEKKHTLFLFLLDGTRWHAASSDERKSLTKAFKKRVADDQHKIGCEKESIRKLIKNRYKEEYSDVLAKMSRYCNSVKQDAEKENVMPINVSEDIFKVNIVKYFEEKGLKFDKVNISPMNEDETNEYLKFFGKI